MAYLLSEKPSESTTSLQAKSWGGKDKLEGLSRGQKKLLITEPRDDLQHLRHLGVDGKSFGLLEVRALLRHGEALGNDLLLIKVEKELLVKSLPPKVSP